MSDSWYFAPEAEKGGQSRASELSANQEKALAALLTNATIEAAAASCGLTDRTLRRYLKDEVFASAYREARDELFTETVTNLRRIASKATADLEAALDDPEVTVRLRADRAILDYLFKGVELERKIRETEELEARIAALEGGAWASANGK